MRMKIRRTEEGRRETGEGRGGAAEAWRGQGGGVGEGGGCVGGVAGRPGADYHPLASSEGLEHLGQRKGVNP